MVVAPVPVVLRRLERSIRFIVQHRFVRADQRVLQAKVKRPRRSCLELSTPFRFDVSFIVRLPVHSKSQFPNSTLILALARLRSSSRYPSEIYCGALNPACGHDRPFVAFKGPRGSDHVTVPEPHVPDRRSTSNATSGLSGRAVWSIVRAGALRTRGKGRMSAILRSASHSNAPFSEPAIPASPQSLGIESERARTPWRRRGAKN